MDWLNDLLKRATDAVEHFRGKSSTLLKAWSFNLDAAGYQEISLQGNFVYCVSATDGTANINIQFSRRSDNEDYYNITQGLGIIHPFDKLHISWDAQATKAFTIWIGNLAPELLNVIDNRSGVLTTNILSALLLQLTGATSVLGYGLVAISNVAPGTAAIASNANRRSVIITNLNANGGNMYIGFDNLLTNLKYALMLLPGESYSADDYLGNIYILSTVLNERISYSEV